MKETCIGPASVGLFGLSGWDTTGDASQWLDIISNIAQNKR